MHLLDLHRHSLSTTLIALCVLHGSACGEPPASGTGAHMAEFSDDDTGEEGATLSDNGADEGVEGDSESGAAGTGTGAHWVGEAESTGQEAGDGDGDGDGDGEGEADPDGLPFAESAACEFAGMVVAYCDTGDVMVIDCVWSFAQACDALGGTLTQQVPMASGSWPCNNSDPKIIACSDQFQSDCAQLNGEFDCYETADGDCIEGACTWPEPG